MHETSAIVIGAGQCGLCMSRALSAHAIDHIVLERGRIGQSWRSERWDSLRMLTPNWANVLPGMMHPDPNGFMTAGEFVDQLEAFAASTRSSIRSHTSVERVSLVKDQFEVVCDSGVFKARAVVLATGASAKPTLPKLAQQIPDGILQLTPAQYGRPTDLPDGGVLVVGASASGAQLARELRLAGHDVTLAIGNHVRLPRRYRGYDIEHWLHVTGVLDQLTGEIFDSPRSTRQPSPQLIGGSHDIDLNALQELGVSVVGRLAAIRDAIALFSGSLAHVASAADLKMNRLLDLADKWVEERGTNVSPPDRPAPTVLPETPILSLALDDGSIRSVIWATGFAPDFSILDLPVFDRRGWLEHDGGVCSIPGLYVLGLPFLRRRRSHHISGAAADASDLAAHLDAHLKTRRAA